MPWPVAPLAPSVPGAQYLGTDIYAAEGGSLTYTEGQIPPITMIRTNDALRVPKATTAHDCVTFAPPCSVGALIVIG